MVLHVTAHVWGETCAAKEASRNKRKKKQLGCTNTGTKSHTPHFPLLLPSNFNLPFFYFFLAPFVSNPMAQQPRLERQLKRLVGKPLNEERGSFSRNQKQRKGTFPPTSCSPASTALVQARDTRHRHMLGSRLVLQGK